MPVNVSPLIRVSIHVFFLCYFHLLVIILKSINVCQQKVENRSKQEESTKLGCVGCLSVWVKMNVKGVMHCPGPMFASKR